MPLIASILIALHFNHVVLIYSCITLSDLTGDGDFKLVVADLGSGSYNMKLRVYKGTQMVSLVSLLGWNC